MNPKNSEVIILADGQAPPAGITTPPRQPKWSDTFTYIADPDKFCRQNLATHGPIFKTSVFGDTTIFVGSASAVQMAFNGDLTYTEMGLPATTIDMFGEYSLFQRPDLHRQRKSALRPGFTGRALEGYTAHINHVIEQGIQSWSTTSLIALFPAVEKICFNILVPLLLGVHLDDTKPSTFEGLPIPTQADLKALYKTYFDGFYSLLRWQSRFTAYGRGLKARAALIEFMRAVIKRRRATGEAINPTADFLSMMLASQQENPAGVFSDALIENQCLLQLWASHYEISGLVSSLMHQLAQYPHVVQRLQQEQATVIAGTSGARGSLEHLKQMVFLDATIKETLRTLPPTSTANRRLTQSVVLEGMLYEKGWVLIAEPRLAHAMPKHFQAPHRFDPERFLPPRNEGKLYEFIPFGGGVHACLGAQMAMVVTKIFASQVLRQFDWKSLGEAKFVHFPLKRLKDSYKIAITNRP
ncbi:MAG: cytochrome P450 [Cyanothece sp. SIO1E1]|nr:cytochrome P450 [Cyanothece sp. SIO1E1]